jgi:integrase
MGKAAKGWELRARGEDEILHVRFRHERTRYERSTGTADPVAAAKEAARIYAEIVSGEQRRARGEAPTAASLPIANLAAKWIRGIDGSTHSSGTAKLFLIHMRAHIIPFFKRLDRVTEAKIEDYQSKRLREVTRVTLRKERMTLRLFLQWCKRRKLIPVIPDFPPLPQGATGTRATNRKTESVHVSPEQVAAFVAALPVLSKGKIRQSHRFPVRARYIVAWETGLRPSTLDKISVPEHYRKGRAELHITADIDKSRYARTVSLTKAARAALDAVVPKKGLIFGKRDYRKYWAEAAKASGMPEGVTPYDLRHGRALALLDASGSLSGVAYALGHKKLTTTDRYLKATRKAGDAVLVAAEVSGANLGASLLDSEKEVVTSEVDS